jgi:dienelactone hydrolase
MALARMATLVAPTTRLWFDAEISVPANARSLVLVAEDVSERTGNSELLAKLPNPHCRATVRPDLRTSDEQRAAELLTGVVDWINRQLRLAGLPIGVLGVFGGASAALVAAARRPDSVTAVACVCEPTYDVRDLASRVPASTLLLVDERDRSPDSEVAHHAARWLDEQLLRVVELWRGR